MRNLVLFILCSFSISCTNKPKADLRFVFIGDIHYSTGGFQTTDSIVKTIAGEVSRLEQKPQLIIQTGDFIHGGQGVDIATETGRALDRFGSDTGIPFYIAKGNHDSRTYFDKLALPVFARELRKDVLRSFYSFDKANCHFIMLDCTEEELEDELKWLENDLKAARSDSRIEHIFAAGHYPLWTVSRAGFTRSGYALPVAALLAKYKVDAYFCGHTHNKTLTVRMINNQPVTQIMDAAVAERGRLQMLAPFLRHVMPDSSDTSAGILPLEEGHQIFVPESGLKYYWGYQEGSATSYYVMTINKKSVQADWHVLGHGIIRSLKWEKPGELVNLKSPEKIVKETLTNNDFGQIYKAWLYAAPWTQDDSVRAPFTINGVSAGIIGFSSARSAGSPFWNEIEVPLDVKASEAIKLNNEISISNPGRYKFGLAHLFLFVKFRDGRFARSSINQKALTSFDCSGSYPEDFPDAELISSVNTGSTLSRVILNFDRFY